MWCKSKEWTTGIDRARPDSSLWKEWQDNDDQAVIRSVDKERKQSISAPDPLKCDSHEEPKWVHVQQWRPWPGIEKLQGLTGSGGWSLSKFNTIGPVNTVPGIWKTAPFILHTRDSRFLISISRDKSSFMVHCGPGSYDSDPHSKVHPCYTGFLSLLLSSENPECDGPQGPKCRANAGHGLHWWFHLRFITASHWIVDSLISGLAGDCLDWVKCQI